MNMDYEKIKAAAAGYQADMTRFLRAMISHPSESCDEKEVVACIKAEMEKLELNRFSQVLMFSTEGNTDPLKFRRVIWDGEYPTIDTPQKPY